MAGLALIALAAAVGVGLIGVSCLFGILARLAQAEAQHKALLAKLERPAEAPE